MHEISLGLIGILQVTDNNSTSRRDDDEMTSFLASLTSKSPCPTKFLPKQDQASCS